jgi:pimeloyl-ACP methyl ester carboxylesterase
MHSIDVDGITLAYEDTAGSGPAVLLVHGFGGTSRRMAAQLEHLRATHRVIAVDRRGHGASDAPQQEYTVQVAADDVAAVAAAAGIEHAVVVVESMDRIGYELAARRPDLVAGLCVIDGPTYAGGDFAQQSAAFAAGLDSPGYQDAIAGFANAMIFAPDNDALLRARVLEGVLATPQHVLASGWRAFIGYDVDAALADMRCPLLMIDAGFPKDLDRLRAACPQLQVTEIAGHGHLPHVFAPATFNAVLDRFLAACSHAPIAV